MVVPALVGLALAFSARAGDVPERVRVRVFERYAPREAVVESGGRRLRLSASDPALQEGTRLDFRSTFTVRLPGLPPRAYAGALSARAVEGRLQLVVESPLEDYVAGVAEAEAGADAPPELLKAQAVAARSWAAAVPPRHEQGGFCDLTHCQVFPGLAGPAARAAAEATKGEVLRRGGRVAAGYYHAACGGVLDAPESLWGGERRPARADVDAAGRPLCALSPHWRWRARLGAERMERLAQEQGWLAPEERLTTLAVADWSPARRALRLKVGGASVRAEAFLSAVGRAFGWNVVKSAAFTLRREGDVFVFEGAGLGHGAGMCQAGARELARRGASYRAILAHYFPDATVESGAEACSGGVCLAGGGDRAAPLLALLARERAALPEGPEEVRVVAHPDFDSFRRAGGDGRKAAHWAGGVLHLAPPSRLEELGILETVVRHEMTHLWVERASRGRAPRWLAEGVCVWRAGELGREDAALDRPVLKDGGRRLSYRQAGAEVARVAAAGGVEAVAAMLRGQGELSRR